MFVLRRDPILSSSGEYFQQTYEEDPLFPSLMSLGKWIPILVALIILFKFLCQFFIRHPILEGFLEQHTRLMPMNL